MSRVFCLLFLYFLHDSLVSTSAARKRRGSDYLCTVCAFPSSHSPARSFVGWCFVFVGLVGGVVGLGGFDRGESYCPFFFLLRTESLALCVGSVGVDFDIGKGGGGGRTYSGVGLLVRGRCSCDCVVGCCLLSKKSTLMGFFLLSYTRRGTHGVRATVN